MKKTSIIIFIILNIMAVTSCSNSQKNNDASTSLYEQKMNNDSINEEDDMPLYVSIIQLIANPAEYHGKKIAVHGVGNLAFEGTAVYFCIDNWYYVSTKNALWLSIGNEIMDDELWLYIGDKQISYEEAQKYNGKYVFIEGTFDMYETGHRGGYSGGIYDITRLDDFSNIYQQDIGINLKDYYDGDIGDWFEGIE